jgi:hypothetical protein
MIIAITLDSHLMRTVFAHWFCAIFKHAQTMLFVDLSGRIPFFGQAWTFFG